MSDESDVTKCIVCGALVVAVCDDEDLGSCVTCHYEQANQDEKDKFIAALAAQRDKLLEVCRGMLESGFIIKVNGINNCWYCNRTRGISSIPFEHAPDCPWLLAKAAIAEVKQMLKEEVKK